MNQSFRKVLGIVTVLAMLGLFGGTSVYAAVTGGGTTTAPTISVSDGATLVLGVVSNNLAVNGVQLDLDTDPGNSVYAPVATITSITITCNALGNVVDLSGLTTAATVNPALATITVMGAAGVDSVVLPIAFVGFTGLTVNFNGGAAETDSLSFVGHSTGVSFNLVGSTLTDVSAGGAEASISVVLDAVETILGSDLGDAFVMVNEYSTSTSTGKLKNFFGGIGSNVFDYSQYPATVPPSTGVTVNMGANVYQGIYGANVTNVHIIQGSNYNDTITGTQGDDVIYGGMGNDTLNGGLGNDTYYFEDSYGVDVVTDTGGTDKVDFTGVNTPSTGVTTPITFNITQTGRTAVSGSNSVSFTSAIEDMKGGTGSDTFAIANNVTGLTGIDGGAPDESELSEVNVKTLLIHGDVIDFSSWGTKVGVNMDSNTQSIFDVNVETGKAVNAAGAVILGKPLGTAGGGMVGIEGVIGGSGADYFVDNPATNNYYDGGQGGDTVKVLASWKTVGDKLDYFFDSGTSGDDELNFSAITDTARLTFKLGKSNVVVNGVDDASPMMTFYGPITYPVPGTNVHLSKFFVTNSVAVGTGPSTVERLIGGSMDDLFYFETNSNVVKYIDGGAGSDWLDYHATDANNSAITVDLATKRDDNDSRKECASYVSGGNDSVKNIENVYATKNADTLTPIHSGSSIIIGGLGADTYYFDRREEVASCKLVEAHASPDGGDYDDFENGILNSGYDKSLDTIDFSGFTGDNNGVTFAFSGDGVCTITCKADNSKTTKVPWRPYVSGDFTDRVTGDNVADYHTGDTEALDAFIGTSVKNGDTFTFTSTSNKIDVGAWCVLGDQAKGYIDGNGGDGTGDLLDFSGYQVGTTGITANLDGGYASLVAKNNKSGKESTFVSNSVKNFEDVTGTDNSDILVGNSGNNVITGGKGQDSLNGGAGDDTYKYAIYDKGGADWSFGGQEQIIDSAGNDKISFEGGDDGIAYLTYLIGQGTMTVNLSQGTSTSTKDYVIAPGIENISGSDHCADIVKFQSPASVVYGSVNGGDGTSTLSAGGTVLYDTLDYSAFGSSDPVSVNFVSHADRGGSGSTAATCIKNVSPAADDAFTKIAKVQGGDGNDTFTLTFGGNAVYGGKGNDTYFVEGFGVNGAMIGELADEGTDVLDFSTLTADSDSHSNYVASISYDGSQYSASYHAAGAGGGAAAEMKSQITQDSASNNILWDSFETVKGSKNGDTITFTKNPKLNVTLVGNEGDDLYTVNLIDFANPNYLQINDFGSLLFYGTDTLKVVGSINPDQIIVAPNYVMTQDSSKMIKMDNSLEAIEVQAQGGNDTIYVTSSDYATVKVTGGGDGSDVLNFNTEGLTPAQTGTPTEGSLQVGSRKTVSYYTFATVNATNFASSNVPPVANNGVATTDEDVAKVITFTSTDTDVPAQQISYAIVTVPAHGTLGVVSGNTVTYTPSLNYNGFDTFTFKANDGVADSNVATVIVTVNPVNDAPVATAQTITVTKNTSKTITLAGTDVDGDTLSYFITSYPTHGSLGTVAGSTVTYVPATDYLGADSFAFLASDGKAASTAAAVSITVSDSVIPASGVKTKLDVNGDGYPEILWWNTVGGNLVLHFLNATDKTAFDGQAGLGLLAENPWEIVGAADMDKSGAFDILWWNNVNGQLFSWDITGTTAPATGTSTMINSAPVDWKPVSFGDLNKDGYTDIIWQSQSTGAIVGWLMGANNTVTNYSYSIIDADMGTALKNGGWNVVGTADFNNDGYLDLVWWNQTSGVALAWSKCSASETVYPVQQLDPAIWKPIGFGDFGNVTTGAKTPDGKTDVIWTNVVNGQNIANFNDGATLTYVPGTQLDIALAPSTGWKIVGTN